MTDTPQPAASSTEPVERASSEAPRYRPRDQFWPYADLQEEPSDDLRPKVEQAVRQCPKQAISIVDE